MPRIFVLPARRPGDIANLRPDPGTPDEPPVVGTTEQPVGRGALIVADPERPWQPDSETQEKPKREEPKPMRVGGDVQMAKLIRQVKPEYPALARQARVYGVVHLVGVIGKDGTIQNLQVISGHPLLARAALDAVRLWTYKPTLLNGEPVEVTAPIDVKFTLSQ